MKEALNWANVRLASAKIEDSRLDAEVLLAHVMSTTRAWLAAHPESMLSVSQRQHFIDLVLRRTCHEPVAYLIGSRPFYGLDFYVDQRVFIPRPETELLVEVAIAEGKKRLQNGRSLVAADIGTGCGAIAIAFAQYVPGAVVYATDISTDALEVAMINATRLGAEGIHFLEGDLLTPLPELIDLLLANLPYIATDEFPSLPSDVLDYEPRLALDGGADGLNLIHRLLAQFPGHIRSGATALLEIGAGQGPTIVALANEYLPGATVMLMKDYANLDRLVRIDLP